MATTFSHFVFVDFENVQAVDLALIEGKPVHVTLLIGEKQKRLELALVRQIHQHAAQVKLIEVGASGRNALDLVLAAHLGRALFEYPEAEFTIISGDHDFDPLVAHFSASKRRIVREADFSALPIFGAAKTPAAAARQRAAARPTAQPRKAGARTPAAAGPIVAATPTPPATPTATTAAAIRERKLGAIITRLRAKKNLPKTRDSLLHYIYTAFGQKLPAEGQEGILNDLVARGVVTISEGNKVVYPA